MNVTAEFACRIDGAAVRAASEGTGLGWCGHPMAAATRAVLEPVPLVDLALEVRDAEIPIFSACKCLDDGGVSSFRRVVVLNKADLADPFVNKKWVKYLKELNIPCYGVGEFSQQRQLEGVYKFSASSSSELKVGDSDYTATVMLVGVPNVGKSAMANSLHQIGRALKDDIIGQVELAEYLLTIVNTAENYKEWEILINKEEADKNINIKPRKKQYATDHAQDFIVRDVRHNLFKFVSSFNRNLEQECNMTELIKTQFNALLEAFRISEELGKDGNRSVAKKVLDLYRIGRLDHYTLDTTPI